MLFSAGNLNRKIQNVTAANGIGKNQHVAAVKGTGKLRYRTARKRIGKFQSVEMRLALTDLYAKNEKISNLRQHFPKQILHGRDFSRIYLHQLLSYSSGSNEIGRDRGWSYSIAVGSTILVVLAAYLDFGLAYYATLLFSISVGVYGLIFTFGRRDDIKLADDAKTKPADKAKIKLTINFDAASPMAVD